MFESDDKINSLKRILSSAKKKKLRKEVDILKLRNMERQYFEELTSIEAEIEFATDQLKELKNQISVNRHQISLVEICTSSEKIKIETHITDLKNRKANFDDVFERARLLSVLRKKELQQNKEEEQDLLRQKEKECAHKIEKLARETAAVEKDCENIERECGVLKKRNAAIMLKLRRKLIETENIRKDLLKRKNDS